MQHVTPILRSRRERRLEDLRKSEGRRRSAILSVGMLLSLALAALILVSALAYADLTRDLPSIELLPRLLNPPDGLLLQPTRIYDRTGQHLLVTFAPDDSPRGYISLNEANPNHLPQAFADGVVVLADPGFWTHSGYAINGWEDPELHPTIAQRLVSDLLLYNEPPSVRRALRERILAAQAVAEYGRAQVLEWYLNSAHFGHYAFGAESAAQLYFGRPAGELNLAEASMLAAVSESPSLNPLDAPQAALQRGRELIHILDSLDLITGEDAARALTLPIAIQPPPSPLTPLPFAQEGSSAFVNLVLTQFDSRFSRARVERGGLTIFTTLDYDLQIQAGCLAAYYSARLQGAADPEDECESARLLPALPPDMTVTDPTSSALILDPSSGQVLALVGETLQGAESPSLKPHDPGSLMTPFIYLTGFTRGLSPASLVWDIPGRIDVQNFDGVYHGPLRARVALANDYRVPAETMMQQMGAENVAKTAASFGVSLGDPHTLLELAGAYGVFATNGVYFGQDIGGDFAPVSILRVETSDHAVVLDWSAPQARPVVSSPLAFLITSSLSDEAARRASLGSPNPLEIGRPVAAKLGQLAGGEAAWAIGYTPVRAVITWTGSQALTPALSSQSIPSEASGQGERESVSPRLPAALWNALMQLASQGLPRDGWPVPPGATVMSVCDPSGLLPTEDCPNVVSEVFASGSEPAQADTLYRAYYVNRETGYLATVFTPAQLVEKRVYMIVPAEAKDWAASAGIAMPPDSYDAIQPPPRNDAVNIASPELFDEVNGQVRILGTAAGDGFVSYRLQVGKGLNPQEWFQIGDDVREPVEDGLLGEWDTSQLSGLYALQLIVVRQNQRVETAVIQVTIENP